MGAASYYTGLLDKGKQMVNARLQDGETSVFLGETKTLFFAF